MSTRPDLSVESVDASGGSLSGKMKGPVFPAGYDRIVYDRVGSTLSEARALLPSLSGPTWILALEQTEARGRRGRAWSTPRGNFAGTLVFRHGGSPARAALRSFVMSLALLRAFSQISDPDVFALKWPNDVLLNGGKVAGILLETVGDHLLIGIGVNLLHAPGQSEVEAGALRPMSFAQTTGVRVTAEAFLDILAAEYAALEHQFQTFGFGPIRAAWCAKAAKLGEVITARTMRDEAVGTFDGVDDEGNLILGTAKGPVLITAADVYF